MYCALTSATDIRLCTVAQAMNMHTNNILCYVVYDILAYTPVRPLALPSALLSLTEHDKHEKIAQILRRHAAKYLQQLLGVELLVLVLKHQLVVKLVVGLRTSNVILTERGWVGGWVGGGELKGVYSSAPTHTGTYRKRD